MNKLFLSRLLSKNWKAPNWRILYYHGIEPHQAATFKEQLLWFGQFFKVVSLTEGVDRLKNGRLNEPLMTITFDDSDASVYENALPIMVDLKIPACLYTVPAYVEKGHSFRDEKPRPTMSWQQLGDCIREGLEVGSHTLTHCESSKCSSARFDQEIRISKEILEDKLGVPIVHFSYPWGNHSNATQEQVIRSGLYESVSIINRGRIEPGADPFYLTRERMNPSANPANEEVTMRMADRFYALRKWRKQHFVSYTDRHPSERWEALETQSINDLLGTGK